MRLLVVTVAVLVLSVETQARIWMTVYRWDGKTPLTCVDPNHPHVYGDIMVGTRLVVVVGSDAEPGFSGWLQFPDDGVMSLVGRGYDPKRERYVGSCLGAAADDADVFSFIDHGAKGFNLVTGSEPSSGDWFIFDYCAERVGTCNLELYDLFGDWTAPIDVVSFTHVPSCDFSKDGLINFEDLALLASRNSPESVSVTEDQDVVSDSTSDRMIDLRDLARLSSRWLERIAYDDPAERDQAPGQ
jgi:hypothetical protein